MLKFNFENVSDLTCAKELQAAGFLGGSRYAIYAFLNMPNVPIIRIGRKKYIAKRALIDFLEKNTSA
jgi:hypothetical protein